MKDEGRGVKDEGRGVKDEGRGVKDEGRGVKDEGRGVKKETMRDTVTPHSTSNTASQYPSAHYNLHNTTYIRMHTTEAFSLTILKATSPSLSSSYLKRVRNTLHHITWSPTLIKSQQS